VVLLVGTRGSSHVTGTLTRKLHRCPTWQNSSKRVGTEFATRPASPHPAATLFHPQSKIDIENGQKIDTSRNCASNSPRNPRSISLFDRFLVLLRSNFHWVSPLIRLEASAFLAVAHTNIPDIKPNGYLPNHHCPKPECGIWPEMVTNTYPNFCSLILHGPMGIMNATLLLS
jgi:hypothetical protein